MFEGYLELGGGEIINSARTRGYAATVDCPVNWFTGPDCAGMEDALAHDPYVYSDIRDAPWYDGDDPVTSRFLGVYGLINEGISDSTREAEVVEGILDGGVVGRVRRATRRIRYEVLLTAIGEDALEAGMAWLKSALTPGRCGTHADACGAADLSMFTACPPGLSQFTNPEMVWNDPITNLFTNPSFEGTGSIPAGGVRSTDWAARGTHSLQVASGTATIATLSEQSLGITPRDDNQTVTFDGDTFTTVAGERINVYGIGPVVLGVGYWDEVTIVPGVYTGPYFDGSLTDTETVEYAWTGAADASTSTVRTGSLVPVPDPIAHAEAVALLTRNIHSVTCVSGPTVVEKLHRGDTWGYIVEFVLVAGVPWLYGLTKPVEFVPTPPIVVQDVPFNLVPYPSAELPGPTLTVATNYATNPSGETNATGWGTTYDGVVITTGSSVPDRSTDIASAGSYSVKITWTAPAASAAAGWFGIQHVFNLPAAAVAGDRYSVNMWAQSDTGGGSPVYGALEVVVYWRTGGTTTRTDILGTISGRSGSITAPSILVPVGVDNVIVRARQHLTSWNAGTIVRLYGDAVAVTVP